MIVNHPSNLFRGETDLIEFKASDEQIDMLDSVATFFRLLSKKKTRKVLVPEFERMFIGRKIYFGNPKDKIEEFLDSRGFRATLVKELKVKEGRALLYMINWDTYSVGCGSSELDQFKPFIDWLRNIKMEGVDELEKFYNQIRDFAKKFSEDTPTDAIEAELKNLPQYISLREQPVAVAKHEKTALDDTYETNFAVGVAITDITVGTSYYPKAPLLIFNVYFYIGVLVPKGHEPDIIKKEKDPKRKEKLFRMVLTGIGREEGYQVPRIFDPDEINISAKDFPEGVYQFGKSFFYLPPEKERDHRKRILEEILNGKVEFKTFPKNKIVAIDLENAKLYYTNTYGDLQEIDISLLPPNDSGLYAVYGQITVEGWLNRLVSRIGLSAFHPSNVYKNYEKLQGYSSTSLIDIAKDPQAKEEFLKFVNDALSLIEEEGYDKNTKYNPITRLTMKGELLALKEHIDKLPEIKERIDNAKKELESLKADDGAKVPLPNLSEDNVLMWHQAGALGKLDKAQSECILDIATGGGKTFIFLMDILNKMKKGIIKRPLIVVPASLVGNWMAEVIKFTDGKINPIAITTETVNTWGKDEIEKICKNAPPNTIFLTTYSFIAIGEEDEYGVTKFKNIPWLRSVVKPDYVGLDESHYIKNASLRSKALVRLGHNPNVKVRTIGTGTLIYNDINDLPRQMWFLNPSILGTPREFASTYGLRYSQDRITEPIPNANRIIKQDIKNYATLLTYREKDWAHTLPQFKIAYHVVKLSPEHKRVYDKMIADLIQEILDDPAIRSAWERFVEQSKEAEAGDLSIPFNLLGKFQKMEQIISTPDKVPLLAEAGIRKSPKIDAVDKLIAETKGKVIVACNFIFVAKSLMNQSRFRKQAIFYDASNKDSLRKFESDPRIKVLFAVVASMKEGHNLQFADRLIIVNPDWTPGGFHQLVARLFRPYFKRQGNKITNANEGRVVNTDYIVAQDTIDVVKIALQVWKKLYSASITEDYDIRKVPSRPDLDPDSIISPMDVESFKSYAKSDIDFHNWRNELIDENRKDPEKSKLLPVSVAKDIKGSRTLKEIPWVVGFPAEVIIGEGKSVDTYLRKEVKSEEEVTITDYRDYKDLLVNKPVRTEFGLGVIARVTKLSVTVKLQDSSTVSLHPSKVLILDKPVKVDTKKTVKEVVKEKKTIKTKDQAILYVTVPLINGIPGIFAYPEKEEKKVERILREKGFKRFPESWVKRIGSKPGLTRLLNLLKKKKYVIPERNEKELFEAVKYLKNGKIPKPTKLAEEEIRNYYRLRHIAPSKRNVLKLYPMVEDNELYVIVNKETHKANLSKFGFDTEDPGLVYFSSKKERIAKIIGYLQKNFGITNLPDLVDDMKNLKIPIPPSVKKALK